MLRDFFEIIVLEGAILALMEVDAYRHDFGGMHPLFTLAFFLSSWGGSARVCTHCSKSIKKSSISQKSVIISMENSVWYGFAYLIIP